MSELRTLQVYLSLIITAGTAMRAGHCILCMIPDSDQKASYKRRLINLLKFYIVSLCISGIITLVQTYF